MKGVGEAGTIAASQAVVNAAVDALEPFGIDHIDMPLTEERVWRAIRDAEDAAATGSGDETEAAAGGDD